MINQSYDEKTSDWDSDIILGAIFKNLTSNITSSSEMEYNNNEQLIFQEY